MSAIMASSERALSPTYIRLGMSFRFVVPRFVLTTSHTCSSRPINSVSSLSAETFS